MDKQKQTKLIKQIYRWVYKYINKWVERYIYIDG